LRGLEKKVARLETAQCRAAKLSELKAATNDLKRELVQGTSVSGPQSSCSFLWRSMKFTFFTILGSLAVKIRKWVRSIAPETLTFYALQLPKEPWQALADIVHLHKEDFQGPFESSTLLNISFMDWV